MSHNIRMIAEAITDDPNVFNEDAIDESWFGSSKKDPLADLVDTAYVKQLASVHRMSYRDALAQALSDIKQEYSTFLRHHNMHDNAKSLQDFVTYKKTGRISTSRERNVDDLDRMGGQDWRR